MVRLASREMIVLNNQQLTTNMRRITLGGIGYKGFPDAVEGSYIKLFFAVGEEQPALRTYTVRSQRHELGEIDVDFVVHGDSGPASAWACRAKAGDCITMGGPGRGRMVNTPSDWFFMVGDMTALPALSVNLEQLPTDARGYVVIEILHATDKQSLQLPAGIEIDWIVNPSDQPETSKLLDAVASKTWLAGEPDIWAACEFSAMRSLRRYFKQERMVGKRQVYASSYWKHGLSENQHKVIKKQDADEH